MKLHGSKCGGSHLVRKRILSAFQLSLSGLIGALFFLGSYAPGSNAHADFSEAVPLAEERKLFSNQFAEISIPASWDCSLAGEDWICKSSGQKDNSGAKIILRAEIKNPALAPDGVIEELIKVYSEPSKPISANGLPSSLSKVIASKKTTINMHDWADVLHLGSEQPGFYTRYLATVEADLFILVKVFYPEKDGEKYRSDLDAMVGSLRAFRKAPICILQGVSQEEGSPNLFENRGEIGRWSIFPPGRNVVLIAVLVLVVQVGFLLALYRRQKRERGDSEKNPG